MTEEVCRIAYTCLVIDECGDLRICRMLPPIANIREMTPREAWSCHKAEESRDCISKCQRDCTILNWIYLDPE